MLKLGEVAAEDAMFYYYLDKDNLLHYIRVGEKRPEELPPYNFKNINDPAKLDEALANDGNALRITNSHYLILALLHTFGHMYFETPNALSIQLPNGKMWRYPHIDKKAFMQLADHDLIIKDVGAWQLANTAAFNLLKTFKPNSKLWFVNLTTITKDDLLNNRYHPGGTCFWQWIALAQGNLTTQTNTLHYNVIGSPVGDKIQYWYVPKPMRPYINLGQVVRVPDNQAKTSVHVTEFADSPEQHQKIISTKIELVHDQTFKYSLQISA